MATSGGRYKPRKLLTLTCKICGEKFQATRPDARYCSATCRSTISRATRKTGKGTFKKPQPTEKKK